MLHWNEEYVSMHFMYGLANGNDLGAVSCTKNDIQSAGALTEIHSKLSTIAYLSMVVLHLHLEQEDTVTQNPYISTW